MPLRPVYRPIVRKNERQGAAVFDVLACNHSVLVDDSARSNTYRRARACPECAAFVARYVAESAAAQVQDAPAVPPRRGASEAAHAPAARVRRSRVKKAPLTRRRRAQSR